MKKEKKKKKYNLSFIFKEECRKIEILLILYNRKNKKTPKESKET